MLFLCYKSLYKLICFNKGVLFMSDNKDKIILPHNVIMKDRGELTISGVTDVDSFDETSVIAYTDFGELTISGTELHISSLNLDKGELSVDGRISGLSYIDQQPNKGGFFSKVFR